MNKSKNVEMILVLSGAMLSLLVVNTYGGQQQVDASKPDFLWCYSSQVSPNGSMCSIDHEECSMLQAADDDAKTNCVKKKNGS
ncbi:MAG TPA: hypothetical protein VH797_03505 [Nitrososphaeraceae archaeon]|jgi:hypothetical protein